MMYLCVYVHVCTCTCMCVLDFCGWAPIFTHIGKLVLVDIGKLLSKNKEKIYIERENRAIAIMWKQWVENVKIIEIILIWLFILYKQAKICILPVYQLLYNII